MLEGVRRMASESAIHRAIGNSDRILQPVDAASADSSNMTLTSAEDFVLSSVDGSWSVAHLAAISPLGEEETLRCMYGLMSAGLLRLRDPADKTTADADRVNAATAQMPPHMIAAANYRTGRAYFLEKDYLEAVVNFREAVRLAPDRRLYHKALGQALSKNSKWRKQAESHFLRVLELEPDDLECYLELAAMY